ncbi:hypothetical protein FZ983_24570 [Azospirillum sp. B21]|uniref:hypothetical protein n=1 Tax=Azospirillum sp. B21 TaxID=2607496 RepID=UPI0011F06931|nr:hypothetical protein [Azospirillum sp. B21]KAA0575745.1 hypothetical protein FZ983_24570 [Azospirillum sp. B21]
MSLFKSPCLARQFLSVYGPIHEHCRPRRHLMPAAECWVYRAEAFALRQAPHATDLSARVRSVIEALLLDVLWRRTVLTGSHFDLRPINPERYARDLLKLDTVGRNSGLTLPGLYNVTMMRAIAKQRLRFEAVEALVSLRAQGQSCWAGTLTLLPHYHGW